MIDNNLIKAIVDAPGSQFWGLFVNKVSQQSW